MTNPNNAPIALVGQLTEDSYPSAQAFAEALVSVMGIPLDTISVIKGAKGEDGKKGAKGDPGIKGDKGDSAEVQTERYNLTLGSTYVDIDYTPGWELDNYKITVNATVGGGTTPFDPATAGIVGVGSMIPVYAEPITKVRVFFVFQGAITGVPSTYHRLSVTRVA